MTFDSTELLREAGYSKGDFVPVATYGTGQSRRLVTSSTAYTDINNFTRLSHPWDEYPVDTQLAVWGHVTVNPGNGETADVRLRNKRDGETIGSEITGATSFTVQTLAPLDYTPATTAINTNIKWQVRTDPGNNTTNMLDPLIAIGVKL